MPNPVLSHRHTQAGKSWGLSMLAGAQKNCVICTVNIYMTFYEKQSSLVGGMCQLKENTEA